jgi:hypothetical protein
VEPWFVSSQVQRAKLAKSVSKSLPKSKSNNKDH